MSGHTSIEVAVLRILFFGYVRKQISNTVLVYYDTSSCYDYSEHNVSSLTDEALYIPLTAIICCLKLIQEIKFYLRNYFGDSKGSYSGIMMHTFQGL